MATSVHFVWHPTWSPLMLTIACFITVVWLCSLAAFVNRRNAFPLVGHSTPVVILSMFTVYIDAFTLLLQGLTNSSLPCEFVLVFNLLALLLASNCYILRAWRIWFRYTTAAARLRSQALVPVTTSALGKRAPSIAAEALGSRGEAAVTYIPTTVSDHSSSSSHPNRPEPEAFHVVLSSNERGISPADNKSALGPMSSNAPESVERQNMDRNRRRSTGDASFSEHTSSINVPPKAATSFASSTMSQVELIQPSRSASSALSPSVIDMPPTAPRLSLSVEERASKRSSDDSRPSSFTDVRSLDERVVSRPSISMPSCVGSDAAVSAQGSSWDAAFAEKYGSLVPSSSLIPSSLVGDEGAATEVPNDWLVGNARLYTSRGLFIAAIVITLLESIAPIAAYVVADKSGDLPGEGCPSLDVTKLIVQANIGLYVFLVIGTVRKLRDVYDAYGIKDQLRYIAFWAIWGLAFGITQSLMERNLYICLFVVMSLGLICQTMVVPVVSSYRGNIFRSSQRSRHSSFLEEHELRGGASLTTNRAVTHLNIDLEGGARNFEPATLASNTIKALTLQREDTQPQVVKPKPHRRARRGTLSRLNRLCRSLFKRSSPKSPSDRLFLARLKQLRLVDVFRDVEMLELFLEHLKREFSVENYLFYCVATEFQRLCEQKKLESTEERNTCAAEIFCKFVVADSDLQVNLDSDTSQKILTDLRVAIPEFSTPTFLMHGIPPLTKPLLTPVKSTIFRNACRATFHLMERDSFTRFKRSHLATKSADILSRTPSRAHSRGNSLDMSGSTAGDDAQKSNGRQAVLNALEYPVVYADPKSEISRSCSLSSSVGVSTVS